jgi:hypothetical protein
MGGGRSDGMSARGVVCGRADPLLVDQVMIGSDRIWWRAVWKVVAHGHRAGSRRVHRRLRLTSRPGRAIRRVRMVAVTVS